MNFFVYTASVLVKKSKTFVMTAAIFRFSHGSNDKEWCKEFVEIMVKKELGKMKMELGEMVTGRSAITVNNRSYS